MYLLSRIPFDSSPAFIGFPSGLEKGKRYLARAYPV